jgi:hypothetical protein
MKPTVHRRITISLAMGIAGIMMSAAQFVLAGAAAVAPRAAADNSAASSLQIIIDSDFKTMIDDGQVLAMAAQLQAQSALQIMGAYVDVDPVDGRSFSDTSPVHAGLQKATIITRFDNARFFDFYVDLLTRPVPIKG